ncbi:lytic transglycosylase domain-containing protein [Methylicorpusculum sp.]|uniref:lytic transglycosylase domain-containing protein n=1 Tax=Methylicorpusculum sp. TaxID=2713644 RepID=UPI00271D62A5|nr:lytic transglycosylase domain-containing protein [Methylicorpusculum sp.]MDO8843131.1 transglycosylase SLT domain-containing protein [Methylicorpusculum sp.]
MTRFVLVFWFFMIPFAAASVPLDEQRSAFLSVSKNLSAQPQAPWPDEVEALKNYPLYPFLRYQWLKQNLTQDQAIERFLMDYSDTLYSALLRRDYLFYLAGQTRWPEYIKIYKPTSNRALVCHYHWARLNTGYKESALQEAKKLWVTSDTTPQACESLFEGLIHSGYFSKESLWERFELSIKKNRTTLASQLMALMAEPDQAIASMWLKVHNDPSSVAGANNWNAGISGMEKIFAQGIVRLADSDVDKAIEVWDSTSSRFALNPESKDYVEGRLGLALAFKKNPASFSRLSRVITPDSSIREWKVRAALIERNWQHVLNALDSLDAQQIKLPRWQYWRARTLKALGQIDSSRGVYQALAQDRSLFGFLAAEKIGLKPELKDRPLLIDPAVLTAFQTKPDLLIVSELRAVNQRSEAGQYWQYLLSKLDKQQILLAAKTAQQWGWHHNAVTTIARAEYWDDLNLRFPLDFMDDVNQAAVTNQLEPSLILGLIRRESIFDPDALSPAGARGLMQLMPGTGKQMASALNSPWGSVDDLLRPEINIKFGSHYFRQMLDRFNGHFMLAVAAYNAGPSKVDSWLSTSGAMPADIWMETLSYKETREYISAVLGYAIIYQLKLNRDELKASQFMQDVLMK